MNELTKPPLMLLPTEEEALEAVIAIQNACMTRPQTPIHTDHLLHAGMYARTITMPPGTALVGTLIKIPTTVIMVGTARVLMGHEWVRVEGYAVLPASANRKQVFVSESAFIITMIFPTDATTVEDAEAYFTEERESLLSRRQPEMNTIRVTGE